MNSDFYKQAELMRDKLDTVSPSLCLAKWKQVTIHLYNGHTHSCHHPVPHLVPLEELSVRPDALHNTAFKKDQRRQMLAGKQPKECDYCWNVEKSGDFLSDRHFKSGEFWASKSFDEIRRLPWNTNVLPSYVEVAFSNQCNFRCSYCSPQISSHWMKEIRESGPYPMQEGVNYHDLSYLQRTKLMPLPDEDSNPYIQAFWDWWPKLYPELDVFRITGGEPLLSKNTFRILDWIKANPRPNLSLGINSNLGVPDATLDRFIAACESLRRDKCVEELTIFTSVDSSAEQAEYIRHGLNYQKLIANIHKIFQGIPGVRVVVMCTFNALSVTGFRGLLEQMLDFRRIYSNETRRRIWLDISYLRHPPWQSLQILTADYFDFLKEHLQFMRAHSETPQTLNRGFQDAEYEKFERMIEWGLSARPSREQTLARNNFYRFFSEHDRRRGTEFLSVFPEMEPFWDLCRTGAL